MPPRHLRKPVRTPLVRRLRAAGFIVPAVVAAATAGMTLHQPATAYLGRDSATVMDAAAAPVPKATGRPASGNVAAKANPKPTAAATPKAPSKKVLAFDFQLQTTYYNCGPAATHMALSAHGANVTQDQLGSQLGTTTNGTASAAETTRVLNSVLKTSFYQTHSIPGPGATAAQIAQLRTDVVHAISNGYGVVANIDGSATDLGGVWHSFPGGHFIAVIGYQDDGQSVEIADSSGMFGAGTYWMSTAALAGWMATHGYSA